MLTKIIQNVRRIPLRPFPRRFKCWNCDDSSESMFCPKCSRIQKPPADSNYFKLLSVEQTYDLDEATLSKRLKDLQKLLHPDKFGAKTPAERSISEEYSSLVNKAYSTLSRPLSRGLYMLSLNGIEIEEGTQLHNEFLAEIMEKNEEVDSADTPEEILRLDDENRKVLNELGTELNEAFKNGNLSEARSVVVRMKYYNSLENQIKDVIRRMNIVK